jgi:hypothetical protein
VLQYGAGLSGLSSGPLASPHPCGVRGVSPCSLELVRDGGRLVELVLLGPLSSQLLSVKRIGSMIHRMDWNNEGVCPKRFGRVELVRDWADGFNEAKGVFNYFRQLLK